MHNVTTNKRLTPTLLFCVRLVAEEAHLGFLPVCEEDYDLCFQQAYADDPRIMALKDVIRSTAYRGILAELPGYRLRRAGQTLVVKSHSQKQEPGP